MASLLENKADIFKYSSSHLEQKNLSKIIHDQKIDIVMIFDFASRALGMIETLYLENKNLIFIGGDGLGAKEIYGGLFQKYPALQVYMTLPWLKDLDNSSNKKFVRSFEKKYSEKPSFAASALMYDAWNLFYEKTKNQTGCKTNSSAD